MKTTLTALLAGLVFGIGLLVSGMADPAKVLGFLDLAGAWDPSLAFVMGGAIGVAAPTFFLLRRRNSSLIGEPMELPSTTSPLTRRLMVGSLIFGMGWGVAGLCPGPAIVAVGQGRMEAVWFVLAMVAGMASFEVLERLTGPRAPATAG